MDISRLLKYINDKVNIFERVKNGIDIVSGVIIGYVCVVVVWTELKYLYLTDKCQSRDLSSSFMGTVFVK